MRDEGAQCRFCMRGESNEVAAVFTNCDGEIGICNECLGEALIEMISTMPEARVDLAREIDRLLHQMKRSGR